MKLFITIAVAAPVVLSIALVAYFIPFRNVLPAFALPLRGEDETRVHFIDVGEGDASLIEFSDGECVLVDAGDGSFEHSEKLLRYLRGVSIKTLSIVATHSDGDHCGGIADVIENFEVETLYLPAVPAETGVYRGMLEAAEERGAETKSLVRYDTIVSETGGYAVCISPYSIGETDENDASSVLYLDCGGVKFLFGADISSARESRILQEYSIDPTLFNSGEYTVDLSDIDVLRVSHHGSSSSSSEAWLELLGAEIAIISCGQGNIYAHPAEEAMQRLAAHTEQIYRTDELGDIFVSVEAGRYSVHTLS